MLCESESDCKSKICNGEVRFEYEGLPPSLQAPSKIKLPFKTEIKRLISQARCLFVHDISVDIVVYTLLNRKYESDSSVDLDNMLKPLLDALAGFEGIIIDDCQVQSINIHWIDSYGREFTQINISDAFGYMIPREDIFFVKFYKGLCFPLSKKNTLEYTTNIIGRLIRMYKIRDMLDSSLDKPKAEVLTMQREYEYAWGKTPCRRVFHISRVNGFPVTDIDELRRIALDAGCNDNLEGKIIKSSCLAPIPDVGGKSK